MSTELTSAKQLLVQFLKDKRDYLAKNMNTRVLYVTQKDLREVKTWSDPLCNYIIINLSSASSSNSCPWCLKQRFFTASTCNTCSYGRRNGICSIVGSRFSKFNDKDIQDLLCINCDELYNLINELRQNYTFLITKEI